MVRNFTKGIFIIALAFVFTMWVGRTFVGKIWKAYAQNGLVSFRLERWVYDNAKAPGDVILKEKVFGDGTGNISFVRSTAMKPDRYVVRSLERIDGLYADVLDELNLRWTVIKSPETATWRLRAVQASCIQGPREQSVGTEMVSGIETVKIQGDTPPTLRVTEWRAPSLACTYLRRLTEKADSAGVFHQQIEYRPIEIVVGPQDSSLFELPSGSTEVKPSELRSRTNQLIGYQVPSQLVSAHEARSRSLDASYAQQPHKQ